MFRRLLGDLPSWAKASNPLFAYELNRHAPRKTMRARAGRVIFWVLVLGALLVGGYLYMTDGFQRSPEPPYTLEIWRVLFFPLLILQTLLRVGGLVLGAGSVDDERRRQTWDALRATEQGASIALRSRWFSILGYRLRPLLVSIWAGRLILLGAMLVELASLQGGLLQILAERSQPPLGMPLSLSILAATMTAFFLLPFTAAGVDVALGLLLSSAVRSRVTASIVLVLFILFRFTSSLLLMLLFAQMMSGSLDLSAAQRWALQAGNAIFADWGLGTAQFTLTAQQWASTPYSIFIGLLMLAAALLQALLADGLLRLAGQLAERRG